MSEIVNCQCQTDNDARFQQYLESSNIGIDAAHLLVETISLHGTSLQSEASSSSSSSSFFHQTASLLNSRHEPLPRCQFLLHAFDRCVSSADQQELFPYDYVLDKLCNLVCIMVQMEKSNSNALMDSGLPERLMSILRGKNSNSSIILSVVIRIILSLDNTECDIDSGSYTENLSAVFEEWTSILLEFLKSASIENQTQAIGIDGCYKLVVDRLKLYMINTKITGNMCQIIACLSESHFSHQLGLLAVPNGNCCTTLIEILTTHFNNVAIMKSALRAIYALMINHVEPSARSSSSSATAISRINAEVKNKFTGDLNFHKSVSRLIQGSSNADITIYCCKIIAQVCLEDSEEKCNQNRIKFLEQDLLVSSLIAVLLNQHKAASSQRENSHIEIDMCVLNALWSLCQCEKYLKVLGTINNIHYFDVLLKQLTLHQTNPDAIVLIVKVLDYSHYSMCGKTEPSTQIWKLLLEILFRYGAHNEDVASAIGFLFRSFAVSTRIDTLRSHLMVINNWERILNVLEANQSNREIALSFCSFIYHVTSKEDKLRHQLALVPKVFEILLKVLRQHKEDPIVALMVSDGIFGMIEDNDDSPLTKFYKTPDSCELIMQTMLIHCSSHDQATHSLCWIIGIVASNVSTPSQCVDRLVDPVKVRNAGAMLINAFKRPSCECLKDIIDVIQTLMERHSQPEALIIRLFGNVPKWCETIVNCLKAYKKKGSAMSEHEVQSMKGCLALLTKLWEFRQPFVDCCKVPGICELLVYYLVKVHLVSPSDTKRCCMLISTICNRGYSYASQLVSAPSVGGKFGDFLIDLVSKYFVMQETEDNDCVRVLGYTAVILDILTSSCNCKWREQDLTVPQIATSATTLSCDASKHVRLVKFEVFKHIELLALCLIRSISKHYNVGLLVTSAYHVLAHLCEQYDNTDNCSVTQKLLGIGKIDWLNIFVLTLNAHQNNRELVFSVFYSFLSAGMIDSKPVSLETQENALDIFVRLLGMYMDQSDMDDATCQLYDAITILVRHSMTTYPENGLHKRLMDLTYLGGVFWKRMVQYAAMHKGDKTLCGIFCNLFCALPWSKNPSSLMEVVKDTPKLIPFVIEILKSHKQDPTTIYCAAAVTHTIMINIHLSLFFFQYMPNFHALIMELINLHVKGNPWYTLEAPCPIGELCQVMYCCCCNKNPVYPEKFKEIPKVVEYVINVLRKHHHGHGVVAGRICGVISCLCVDDPAITKKFQLSEDCCELLVKTLRIHQRNEVIIAKVCDAMIQLAYDDNGKANFGRIANCCDLLMSTMKLHAKNGDTETISKLTETIKRLFSFSENALKFDGLLGGCWNSFMDAFKKHKTNQKIISEISETLFTFGQYMEQKGYRLQQDLPLDYYSTIAGVLQEERKNKNIVPSLLQLLLYGHVLSNPSASSSNSSLSTRIMKKADIDIVIGVFKIYRKNARILQLCLEVLGRKSIFDSYSSSGGNVADFAKIMLPMMIEFVNPYLMTNIDLVCSSCVFLNNALDVAHHHIQQIVLSQAEGNIENFLLAVLRMCIDKECSGKLSATNPDDPSNRIIVLICQIISKLSFLPPNTLTTEEYDLNHTMKEMQCRFSKSLEICCKFLASFKTCPMVKDILQVISSLLIKNVEEQDAFIQAYPQGFRLLTQMLQMHGKVLPKDVLISLIELLNEFSIYLRPKAIDGTIESIDVEALESFQQSLNDLKHPSHKLHNDAQIEKVANRATSELTNILVSLNVGGVEKLESMYNILNAHKLDSEVVLRTCDSIISILHQESEERSDSKSINEATVRNINLPVSVILELVGIYKCSDKNELMLMALMSLLMLELPIQTVTNHIENTENLKEDAMLVCIMRCSDNLVDVWNIFASWSGRRIIMNETNIEQTNETLTRIKVYLTEILKLLVQWEVSRTKSMVCEPQSRLLLFVRLFQCQTWISEADNLTFLLDYLSFIVPLLKEHGNEIEGEKELILEALFQTLDHYLNGDTDVVLNVCRCVYEIVDAGSLLHDEKITENEFSADTWELTMKSVIQRFDPKNLKLRENILINVLDQHRQNSEVVTIVLQMFTLYRRYRKQQDSFEHEDDKGPFSVLTSLFADFNNYNKETVSMISELLLVLLMDISDPLVVFQLLIHAKSGLSTLVSRNESKTNSIENAGMLITFCEILNMGFTYLRYHMPLNDDKLLLEILAFTVSVVEQLMTMLHEETIGAVCGDIDYLLNLIQTLDAACHSYFFYLSFLDESTYKVPLLLLTRSQGTLLLSLLKNHESRLTNKLSNKVMDESVKASVAIIIACCQITKLFATIPSSIRRPSPQIMDSNEINMKNSSDLSCYDMFHINHKALTQATVEIECPSDKVTNLYNVLLCSIDAGNSYFDGKLQTVRWFKTRRNDDKLVKSSILISSSLEMLLQVSCESLVNICSTGDEKFHFEVLPTTSHPTTSGSVVDASSVLRKILQHHQDNERLVSIVMTLVSLFLSKKISKPMSSLTNWLDVIEKLILHGKYFYSTELQEQVKEVHARLLVQIKENHSDEHEVTNDIEKAGAINNVPSSVASHVVPAPALTSVGQPPECNIATQVIPVIPSSEIVMDSPLDFNVYKALWRRSNVAIKIYRSVTGDVQDREGAMTKMKAEMEVLSSLRHPRLVSVLGCCLDIVEVRGGELLTTEGCGFVIEYMDKGNLRMVLNKCRMSWIEKLTIAVDIAEGMMFLQESKVCHGNLTSANVLVDGHNRAKLINFGDNRRDNAQDMPSQTTIEKNPTKSENNPKKKDFLNDIYGFGVILWELTATTIFEDYKNDSILVRLTLPSKELPDIPPCMISCFDRCMESTTFPPTPSVLPSNTEKGKKKGKKQNKQQQSLQNSKPIIPPKLKPLPYFHELFEELQSVLRYETKRLSAKEHFVPEGFLCPITQDIMKDPVMLVDGHSYERHAIMDWFQRSNRSPLTNEELSEDTMMDNYALKSAIESFVATFHQRK